MKWSARVAIAIAILGSWFVTTTAVSAAFPGQHLWTDVVHTADVFEDEAAAALVATPTGCPIVVGSAVTATGAPSDIRHVSYQATTSLWRWNSVPTTWGAGGADTAVGVARAGGFDYVAGTAQGTGADTDLIVIKLDDATGAQLWAVAYDGPVHGADEAEAVAADAAGNVYVTGGSRGAGGSMDMVTIKVRSNGSTAWVRRYDGPSHQLDRGLALAVSGSSVYVAGITRRPGHSDDVVLIKYSAGGARRWARFYDDPLHRAESVGGISATATTIHVCGAGRAGAVAPGDALLLAFGNGGALRWVAWAGDPSGDDSWSDVATDSLGRAHVTGTLFRTTTAADIATSVYEPNGDLSWRRYLSSVGCRADGGTALALDAGGRTYVCGTMENAAGNADIAVVGYAAHGASTL